jgi:L-ascorbate metabolism protein UlaG (beta-lactamase superfamily)
MCAWFSLAPGCLHVVRNLSHPGGLRLRRAAGLKGFAVLAFVLASAFAACAGAVWVAGRQGKPTVRWFGHSYFLITSSKGLAVAIDPFDKRLGYPVPRVEADIVAVTHRHFDHDAVGNVGGNPEVLMEPRGARVVEGVPFVGVKTFHDEQRGRIRGPNQVICFELDGIRFCHLGDLGHILAPDQVREIGRVDVLFVPVGGYYTIDAQQAAKVVSQLKPRIAVPIHYRTARTLRDSPLATADGFAEAMKRVRIVKGNSFSISREQLPKETTAWIFDAFGR